MDMNEFETRKLDWFGQRKPRDQEEVELATAVEEAKKHKDEVGMGGTKPSNLVFGLALRFLSHDGTIPLTPQDLNELRKFAENYLHTSLHHGFPTAVIHTAKKFGVTLA